MSDYMFNAGYREGRAEGLRENNVKLESDLARVTELLKSACGYLLAIQQEYQFLTLKEFFAKPEIKELIK